MEPPALLATSGRYAPVIHYGSQRWQHGQAPRSVYQHLPTYAVVGVVEGRHRLALGRQQWLLAPGQVAILPPDHQWRHQIARGSRLLYLVGSLTHAALIGPVANGALHLHPSEGPQPQPRAIWGLDLPVVQPPEVTAGIFADLYSGCDLWWRGDVSQMRANHHFASVFMRAVVAAAAAGADRQRVEARDPVIERAMDLLAGRPPPHSAGSWAAAVGMHRNRFTEHFMKHVCEQPGAFLRQLRLRRAMAMLEHSDESLHTIAIEAGYRNVAALGAAFRKQLGCSPSAFRQQRR